MLLCGDFVGLDMKLWEKLDWEVGVIDVRFGWVWSGRDVVLVLIVWLSIWFFPFFS